MRRFSSLRRIRLPWALLCLCLVAGERAVAQTLPGRPVSPPPSTPPAVGSTAGSPEDEKLFVDAARIAWTYVDQQYQPATGLINSVAGYTYATMWDIAGGLGALYCANRLGLLDDAEYHRRMRRALLTLQGVRLYDRAAFNKNYSTRTGRPAGRDDRDSKTDDRGYGWSALDIGRFLIWLKIIAVNDPAYATDIQAIVARLDFPRMVESGYLWGATLNRRGQTRRYTEGRLPYEQYAAVGFGLWGHPAEKAARLEENGIPIAVMDVPLLADRRGHEHLTSEPLVLMGLEIGWSPGIDDFARRVLRVQEERHRRTGQVTIVSEDAIPRAPHYFYYYTINYHGNQFAITTQTPDLILNSPRWISAKAAYGWHALVPSDYTRLAARSVARAAAPARGWSSGVYEQSGEPTGSHNINTAAVILEAALYHRTGAPLLPPAP